MKKALPKLERRHLLPGIYLYIDIYFNKNKLIYFNAQFEGNSLILWCCRDPIRTHIKYGIHKTPFLQHGNTTCKSNLRQKIGPRFYWIDNRRFIYPYRIRGQFILTHKKEQCKRRREQKNRLSYKQENK